MRTRPWRCHDCPARNPDTASECHHCGNPRPADTGRRTAYTLYLLYLTVAYLLSIYLLITALH